MSDRSRSAEGRPGRSRAVRRVVLVVPAAMALGALGAIARLTTAPAAEASVSEAIIDGSATASATATRLRPPGPVFPMEATPRCDILSNFGDSRSGGRSHQGVDMLSTLGQKVFAASNGTLVAQFAVGGPQSALSGNAWRLAGTDGTEYFYAHLSAFAPDLVAGSVVTAGQLIGYVGDTGDAGPGNYHLHFELHPGGGAAVDPLPLLAIPPVCRVF